MSPLRIFWTFGSYSNRLIAHHCFISSNFPDEIAIVGFDNLPICEHHRPTISSVETSFEDLGLAIIETLREKASNPGRQKGRVTFVPVALKERASS